MLAVNFQNVGETATIDIQDLINGKSEGLTGGTGAANSDRIMIYDAATGNYTTYFLYNNSRQPTNVKNGKWVTTASGYPVATKAFKNGDSFWYNKFSDAEANVSVSGQVSLEEAQTIDIVKGYNMIGSAFPMNFNPNTLGADYWKSAIAAGAVGGTGAANSDRIMIYDNESGNYTTYFLYNNARQATNTKNGKWVTTASGYPVISDDAEVLATGKGAWYDHKGNGFTLIAVSPIK